VKNVISGSVVEKTYNPSSKFPSAFIERRNMEYSYADGDLYYFMDQQTYEQEPISKSELTDAFRFVKENMVCMVLSYKGKVFGVEPPNFVELQITETDPGFKGDTATNTFKPAIVETGAEVKVPLFIEQGEVIRINTETGEYMERANS
jgi:elongation factor P